VPKGCCSQSGTCCGACWRYITGGCDHVNRRALSFGRQSLMMPRHLINEHHSDTLACPVTPAGADCAPLCCVWKPQREIAAEAAETAESKCSSLPLARRACCNRGEAPASARAPLRSRRLRCGGATAAMPPHRSVAAPQPPAATTRTLRTTWWWWAPATRAARLRWRPRGWARARCC